MSIVKNKSNSFCINRSEHMTQLSFEALKQLEEAITAAIQGITVGDGYVWNIENPFRNKIASISPGDLVFVDDSDKGIYVIKCEHYHEGSILYVKINDVPYQYDSITGIIHLHPIEDDKP